MQKQQTRRQVKKRNPQKKEIKKQHQRQTEEPPQLLERQIQEVQQRDNIDEPQLQKKVKLARTQINKELDANYLLKILQELMNHKRNVTELRLTNKLKQEFPDMREYKLKQSLTQGIKDLQEVFAIMVEQKIGYHINTKTEQDACKEAFLKQQEDDKLSTVSISLEYFIISNMDELKTFFEKQKFRRLSLQTPLKKIDYEAIFSMKPQIKDLKLKWDKVSYINELKKLEQILEQLRLKDKNFGTQEAKIINLKLIFDKSSFDFRIQQEKNPLERDRNLFSRMEGVIFSFSRLRLLKIKLPYLEMHKVFYKGMIIMIVQVPVRFLYLEKFKFRSVMSDEVQMIDTFSELEKNERQINRPYPIHFIKIWFGQDKIKRTLGQTDLGVQSFRYSISFGDKNIITPTAQVGIEQFLIERKNNIQQLILFRDYNIFNQQPIHQLINLRNLKIKLLSQTGNFSEECLMLNQIQDIENILIVSKFSTNTSSFYPLEAIMTRELPKLYEQHLKIVQLKRNQPTLQFTYVTNSDDNNLLCYNRMKFTKMDQELKLEIQINYVKLVYVPFLGQFLKETFQHNQKVVHFKLDLVHFLDDESLQQTIKSLSKNLYNENQLNLTLSLSFGFSISKLTNEAFCELFRESMKLKTKLCIFLTFTEVQYFQKYICEWLRTISLINNNTKESSIYIQFDNEFWMQLKIQEAKKVYSWISASKTILSLDLNRRTNREPNEIVQKCYYISHKFLIVREQFLDQFSNQRDKYKVGIFNTRKNKISKLFDGKGLNKGFISDVLCSYIN